MRKITKISKKDRLINQILNSRDQIDIDDNGCQNYDRTELEALSLDVLEAIFSTIGEDML